MLNILIVHHCDSWGGAGVSLYDMCEMLAKTHKVSVCLPSYDSEVKQRLSEIEGLDCLSIGMRIGMISAYSGGPKFFSRTFLHNLYDIKKSSKKIVKMIKDNKYDLIIGNSITLSWIGIYAKKLNIPYICYVRETKPNNIGFWLSKMFINKYCSGVLFISEYDKYLMKFKTKNQCVVRDCIHLDTYSRKMTKQEACEKFGLPSETFNCLYVGGDAYFKGYDCILDSAKLIEENNDICFIIAGSVSSDKRIKRKNIHYIGKVMDMPSVYSACDILIFPSLSAHQARPVFEAGALGLPVIISDFPETAGEVKNEYNGLVFTPGDSIMLKDMIIRLFDEPTERIKLGINNKNNAMLYHEFNACAKDLNKFIDDIID